jgi:radical SAM superfamily enzyme YgiQ (UPF0313 family)
MKADQCQIDIWLCDLTYTQQTLASDIMPNAIGCIAAYANKILGNHLRFKLFKRPEVLAEWLQTKPMPQMIGFSNYAWNGNLALQIAQAIKRERPEIPLVLGGPNYPLGLDNRKNYVQAHSYIDYFVIKEGEVAFTDLLQRLINCDFEGSRITESIPSVDFLNSQGDFVASPEMATRIKDLAEIPSPYVAGLLDEYFDGKWLPIVETARGCPFECTFCVEGGGYYTRVNKSTDVRVKGEIEYIAKKMHQMGSLGARSDLHIADSNFGMYKEDLETCKFLGEMQQKYGFPKIVNASTGKNKPERVLAAAKMTNGALRISGSVQSLDPQVLTNIKRGNISSDKLMELTLSAQELGASTYSELIMGLPGSTKEEHFESIRKIMDAEFDGLCLYQLMLLPGTDLGSQESRRNFEFKTAFRVIPRCYGSYNFFDEDVSIGEIEEIVIGSNTMTFDDYLDTRKMHLIINIFYNNGVYKDIFPLLKHLGVKNFDWMKRIHSFKHPLFEQLLDEFIVETKKELWDDREALEDFISKKNHIEEFFAGERGNNLIFKYKVKSITECSQILYEVAARTLKALLEENSREQYIEICQEILKYSTNKMANLFDMEHPIILDIFTYDIESYLNEGNFDLIKKYKIDETINIEFFQTAEQHKIIKQYLDVYGNNTAGLSRIVTKVDIGQFFRSAEITSKCHS